VAFITPTQEKCIRIIIRWNILLLDLGMNCFKSCLINRINSQGENISLSLLSVCVEAQEDAEYSTQTFQMQFKEKPAPEESHFYICSSVIMRVREREREREREISLWTNSLISCVSLRI